MHYTFYPLPHFTPFSLFLPLFCTYMWHTFRVCMVKCGSVYSRPCAQRPKVDADFFLDCSPVPQAVSPTEPELTNSALANQLAPRTPCLHLPSACAIGSHHTCLSYIHEGSGELNSGLHTHAASTLSTELSSSPTHFSS